MFLNVEMTADHDKKWEEFLYGFQYWSDWRNMVQGFNRVSDLEYYCLRLSKIIIYKDKVSDYGSIRNQETFAKVDEFAWKLMRMSREEFHKKFGGYFDKKTENYMINSDGTYSNILFSNNTNYSNSDSPSCFITELGDEEEIVQDNNNHPNDELLTNGSVKSRGKRDVMNSSIENSVSKDQREKSSKRKRIKNKGKKGKEKKHDSFSSQPFPEERIKSDNEKNSKNRSLWDRFKSSIPFLSDGKIKLEKSSRGTGSGTLSFLI